MSPRINGKPLQQQASRSNAESWVIVHLEQLLQVGFIERELFGGQYPLETVFERLPTGATISLKGAEVIATWKNPHDKQIIQRAWPDCRIIQRLAV